MTKEQLENMITEIKNANGVNVVSTVIYVVMDVALADKTAHLSCPVRIKIRNSKKAIRELMNYINPDDLITKSANSSLTSLGVFNKEVEKSLENLIDNDRDEFNRLMDKVNHDFFFINGRGQYADRIFIKQ